MGNNSDIAIQVNNVTKCYHIYDSPRDRLKQIVLPRVRKILGLLIPKYKQPKNYFREFFSLRNINFEIKKGQTVGVIGRNGSGKSTLLQLVCNILTATSGEIKVNGRVAALLELGAGFNPEFTGRENVYMNATIMGFSKEEIDVRYQDIVAFADLGDFIEQPVKTYSSGMYVRLAFATAINVNPDVLIVDEALAVGDMLFQAKCMTRMREMMNKGTTVLFVSHDMGAVKALCQQAIFLEKGEIIKKGVAADVVDAYLSMMRLELNQELKKHAQQKLIAETKENAISFFAEVKRSQVLVSIKEEIKFAEGSLRYGEGGARILDIKLLDKNRLPSDQFEFRDDFCIQVSVVFEKDLPSFCIGYSLRDLKGQMLVGTVSSCEKLEMPSVQVGEVYVLEIRSTIKLNAGIYTVSIAIEQPVLINQQHVFLDIVENALVFKVSLPADPRDWFPCIVHVPTEFACIQLENL